MDTDATRLQLSDRDGHLVVSGEIDASTCTSFDDWLGRHHDGNIVIDMAEVTFIDSSGLRVLIAHHQRAADDGRRLEIVEPSHTVQRLFEITGLTDVLHIRTA